MSPAAGCGDVHACTTVVGRKTALRAYAKGPRVVFARAQRRFPERPHTVEIAAFSSIKLPHEVPSMAITPEPRLQRTPREDWKHASLASLTRHISAIYHAPLLERLPHLHDMLARIERDDATRWPELIPPLVRLVRGLTQEISFHTNEEEDRLFPAIAAIESREAVELHGRTLDRFLERLEDEHFLTGRMLQHLQTLTGGFEPPEGASSTLVALYRELDELSAMLRMHVHLENHVLFPRAAALSRARADAVDVENEGG
jgi:regulator of cell morphogenesis and NO signaling